MKVPSLPSPNSERRIETSESEEGKREGRNEAERVERPRSSV